MTKAIYAVGTMDTKGDELAYIAERIRAAGGTPVLVDVGTGEPAQMPADITRETVAAFHPQGHSAALAHRDRGQAVTAMSQALQVSLLHKFEQGKVAGVIGIGGTGGTALISPALRALPIGAPKVIVSTVASGNTAPYVGTSDFAIHAVRSDVIVLCHGGPIAIPDDAACVLQRTKNVHGFYGDSSMERLPTEIAITEQIKAFEAVSF